MAIDDGVNLEDDAEDEVEDEDEDLEDAGEDEGDEVGGGEEDSSDGNESESVAPVSSLAQLRQLLEDPEIQSTLQDQIADYQARINAEAMSQQEAEAFQKLIDDEDWEAVGKTVYAQRQKAEVQAQVRDQVTREMFAPVYQDLFKQPEMQSLTAEDRERLQLDAYPSAAAHVAAVTSYIAEKRYAAQLADGIKKGVAEALEAEKNKDTAGKVKAPSVAGRSPAPIGVVQPKLSSADLIRSGLRGIIGVTNEDSDDV